MTTFPGSPRITKGALVGIDAANPLPSVIVFQYNPQTMTRTLQPQNAGGAGGIFETQRLKGAPVETIKLDVLLDATDRLERDEIMAGSIGVTPYGTTLFPVIHHAVNLDTADGGGRVGSKPIQDLPHAL